MEHKLAEDGEGAVVQGVSHHSFRPLGVPGVSGVPRAPRAPRAPGVPNVSGLPVLPAVPVLPADLLEHKLAEDGQCSGPGR